MDYNWNRYTRIVDIGGAYGSFLARLLRRNRRARGVVFDQPQVRPLRFEHWSGLLQLEIHTHTQHPGLCSEVQK